MKLASITVLAFAAVAALSGCNKTDDSANTAPAAASTAAPAAASTAAPAAASTAGQQ